MQFEILPLRWRLSISPWPVTLKQFITHNPTPIAPPHEQSGSPAAAAGVGPVCESSAFKRVPVAA